MTEIATNSRPTDDQLEQWFDDFSNWGRWGSDDTLGAINLITAEKKRAAAALVTEGLSMTLARVIEFAPKPDPGEALLPPLHFMQAAGECADEHGSGTAVDWAGLPLHGLYVTHLDAHAHIFWKARFYNDQPASAVVTDRGALRGGIDTVRDGLFTRGVLLDIPRVRGGEPLGPDDAVTAAEIAAAEEQAGLQVQPGDVILVRTGYGGSRKHRARGETSRSQPGVGTDCLPFIHDRQPAVLGTDTATDPTWAHNGRVNAPVHSICMVAMGMWIIDGCDLEDLAATCERLGRWEFLFTAAPLRLKNSTGSPFNPIAVF